MSTVKLHTVDWAQISRFLQSAQKKLASAQKILAFDEEASLEQAYEAMLKASLAFMFSHGVRPRSQPGHHVAMIEFVRPRIDKSHGRLLTVFDRLRRKRNTALYDDTGFVSQHDAEEAIATAREYLARLRLRPTSHDPSPARYTRHPLPKGEGKKCRNPSPLPRGEGGRRRRPGEGSLACNVAEKLDSKSQVPNLKPSRCYPCRHRWSHPSCKLTNHAQRET